MVLTLRQQRLKEFYSLYNITDLLPFFRLKSFWKKISLKFFVPVFSNPLRVIDKKIESFFDDVLRFIQGFKPV